MLHRAFDGYRHDVDVERLGDEVVGAGADRLHGGFHTTEGGDHDHRQLRVSLGRLLTQLQTAHVAHVDVGQHDVEITLGELHQRLMGGSTPARFVAVLNQPFGEQFTHA